MRLMELLQLPHILLQGRVRVKVVQHTAVQSLEGNVRFHSFHISLSSEPVSGLPRNIMLPYLHEHFDMLVLPQEISAERHPL